MTEGRKAKLQTEVDSSGAKKGFEEIKQGARDVAQTVTQSAQQAGKAVEGIGSGGSGAAQKLDTATKSIIGSIQRTTATMEAGERGTRKFFESLAAQRNISLDTLRPYLDQLDEAAKKQAAASGALNSTAGGLGKVADSAKQTAYQLRQVAPQVTDIVTQLAAGQAPLQILIQQGGQLKDVFGGIGPAARALGGYLASLINPATLAIGAIGGVGYAAYLGAKELDDLAKQAVTSGNALAGSIDRYAQLRDSLVGIAGTKGKAAEVLSTIAASAQLAGRNIQLIGDTAVLMEKATGQAIGKTVDQFARLADSPASAAAELNKQTNFLTASVYAQIRALEQQGKQFEAGEVAIKAFGDTMKQRAQQVVDDAGYIEQAWRGITGAIKGAVDALKDIGRPTTLSEQLATLQENITRRQALNAQLGIKDGAATAELQQQAKELQRRIEIQTGAAAAQDAINAANLQGVKAVDALTAATDKYAPKAAQAKKAIDEYRQSVENLRRSIQIGNTKATPEVLKLLDPATIARTESGIRSQFVDNAGASNVASQRAAQRVALEENARLLASIANLDFTTPTKLTDAEKKVIQIQEELKEALNNTARANKERELDAAQAAVQDEKNRVGLEKQRDALKASSEAARQLAIDTSKQADALNEQAAQQELANQLLGKSKTAYEQATLALLKHQLAEADSSDSFDPKYVAALAAKVAAQERYVASLQEAEFRQKQLQLTEAGRSSKEEAQTLALELSLVGQTQEVRERILGQRRAEVALAKELQRIDELNLGGGGDAADRKREQLKAQARANYEVDAQNAAQRSILNEWQRTADSINQSLTDALLRGFESGKGFASNFRDTLKNMFKTLVLQPVIKAVLAPVSGTLAGIGQSIGQSITGGGGSSILGTAGTLSNAAEFLGIGGGVGATLSAASYAAAVPGLTSFAAGSQAAMLAAQTSSFGAAGLGATAAAGGSALGGAIAAIGAAAPYIAAVIAIAALLSGSFKGETRSGGQYVNGKLVGGPSGGEINGDATRQAIAATQESVNAYLKALGSSQSVAYIAAGLESSKEGKGFAYGGIQLSGGAVVGQGIDGYGFQNRRGNKSEAQAAADFAEELKQVQLEAIAASDAVGPLADYVRSLGDISQLTGAQLDTAVNRVANALTQKQQLEDRLFDLTATDAEKLARTRERELAAIDETNRALLQEVYTREDQIRAIDTAKEAVQRAYDVQKTSLEGARDSMKRLAESAAELRTKLLVGALSPLTPGQKYAELLSQYAITKAQRDSGDVTAGEKLNDLGQQLLDASRTYNASGEQYRRDFAMVLGDTQDTKTLAQQQYDVSVQQLSQLDQLVAGIIGNTTATLSVKEAVLALANAQTGQNAGDVVTGLYRELFNKTPDQEGYNFWINQLAQGKSIEEVRRAMIYSGQVIAARGYATGLDRVPYDGFPAILHEDEAVLNRAAADQWRSGANNGVVEELRALRAEVQQLRESAERNTAQAIGANAAVQMEAAERVAQATGQAVNRANWQEASKPVIA